MTEEFDIAGLGAGAVVVGADDSACAHVALTTAIREAALREVPVLVVRAYDPPDRWGPEAAGLVDVDLIERELCRVTEEAVAAAAAEVTGQGTGQVAGEGTGAPRTRVVIAPGGAAGVLCLVAEGAELLVVGHRGRGALASRLIGSVGLGVVVHASCPVLVVRAAPTAPTAAV